MTIIHIIGQILLGGFFLYSGFNHLKHLDSYTGYAESKHVPHAKFAVMFTGIMLAIGGLSIMTGFLDQAGALVLVVFLIATTYQMHAFWKADPGHRANEMVQFSKNVALIGALLMLAAK